MLDNTTRKNIDDCRDVLVGKVPDPKSQIEQITLALIYKFMDDMDREAVEKYKGKAKFFTGQYSKYGWRKLFDPSLSGKDMLDLYSNALDKLQTNPNIPELFRNIFKNAYLPYRDPSTLKLFLKHINEFEYSHSEKLGDAFEYLLSVMGSQGDAGQFRTPRNIIDFIVACVDPQKNETVADVACGTAGFLLSAYKHILKQNTDKRAGDKLTPDQRKKLATNFMGYDISPDMVRLSLANMYLHGFTTPQIYEYDTLSSEDRWNETFDVILANPPFMTPKGGIRPHKKFGVQANKAEVLFTDYIAEHLNNNGRAGIVVPNGIVATTQTAYKQLRKLLVSDGLVAVVSLPAGCFNPYSGVKTSVLLLDKALAKKSNHILFIKVANDGFDLGAQRRESDKNDLPLAVEAFNAYKKSISTGKPFNQEKFGGICLLVEKEKILANKDVVLSGERYMVTNFISQNYPMTTFDEICEIIKDGTHYTPTYFDKGYVFLSSKNVTSKRIDWINVKYIDEKQHKELQRRVSPKLNDILLAKNGTTGVAAIVDKEIDFDIYVSLALLRPKGTILSKYLWHFINSINVKEQFNSKIDSVGVPNLHLNKIKEVEIPLPPLDIQEQIVKEIEGYQKVIDGAKMVVENYKPTIRIKPEWEMVELGEVCEINPKKSELKELSGSIFVSFVPMADLNENEIDFIPKDKKKLSEVVGSYTYFRDNDVLLAKVTPCFENGKAGIARNLEGGIGFGSSEFYVLRPQATILPEWIYLNIKTDNFNMNGQKQMSGTSGLQRLPKNYVASFSIPLPPLKEQAEQIEKMKQEQQIVDANKNLIALFEQKIKDRINEVWGVREEVES